MATETRDMARITANGTYSVAGLVPGRRYIVGLFYTSGTGTMTISQKHTVDGPVNDFYDSAGTAALTVTASTPKFQTIRVAGDHAVFTISLASSLVATLRVIPVQHGF